MRTVHKFPIDLSDAPTSCLVTKSARFIHFGQQGGSLFVWIEVDASEEPDKMLLFAVKGTGWPIESSLTHRGTVIMEREGLVWHLYEYAKIPGEAPTLAQ